MPAPKKYILALRYAFTLMIVLGLVFYIGDLFQMGDLTWALVSAVVCTELEIDKAYFTVIWRIVATLTGISISIMILLLFGATVFSLIFCLAITTLLSYCIFPEGNSWKVATISGLLVLASSLAQHSIPFAESVALKRAAEVVYGSLVAGVVSIIINRIWKIAVLTRRKND